MLAGYSLFIDILALLFGHTAPSWLPGESAAVVPLRVALRAPWRHLFRVRYLPTICLFKFTFREREQMCVLNLDFLTPLSAH